MKTGEETGWKPEKKIPILTNQTIEELQLLKRERLMRRVAFRQQS